MRLRSRSKYRAVPTVVDGIRFASKREAQRYQELRLLERAGEIHGLKLQPRFVLSVHNENYPETDGRLIDLGSYVADFSYMEKRNDGTRFVVEDAKGFRTPLYRWKKKHVEAQFGIEIREV